MIARVATVNQGGAFASEDVDDDATTSAVLGLVQTRSRTLPPMSAIGQQPSSRKFAGHAEDLKTQLTPFLDSSSCSGYLPGQVKNRGFVCRHVVYTVIAQRFCVRWYLHELNRTLHSFRRQSDLRALRNSALSSTQPYLVLNIHFTSSANHQLHRAFVRQGNGPHDRTDQ